MSSRILSLPFIVWAIINLGAGIWEVFAFMNRDKLRLEARTLWDKMRDGEITVNNFWMEGRSEYCKVDSRYIYHPYVWCFELINAVIAVIFILAVIYNSVSIIKLLLQIAIINCVLYFVSLYLEYVYDRLDARYARWWQYPIYYLISGIWLIVPVYLYLQLSSSLF